MEVAIVLVIAALVVAFWAKWGAGVMNLAQAMLTPAETAPQRVTIHRRPALPRRDGFEELLLEAEWRDLESAEALTELKAEMAELEKANRAV
ncbi:hypothetical protein GF391_03600 [Candidatus Uhrbacteria bacterium]|nr:hypothetical protein [Candidatus Uhrbacteria bacterium]